MNHLVGLEPCPCGAYRYLAARKLKRLCIGELVILRSKPLHVDDLHTPL